MADGSHLRLTELVTIWHRDHMARRDPDSPTHEEIARVVGKDRSYVTKMLSGQRKMPLDIALTIHRRFGLKLGPLAKANDAEIKAAARIIGAAA